MNFNSDNKIINFNKGRIVCCLMVSKILKESLKLLGLLHVDKL